MITYLWKLFKSSKVQTFTRQSKKFIKAEMIPIPPLHNKIFILDLSNQVLEGSIFLHSSKKLGILKSF